MVEKPHSKAGAAIIIGIWALGFGTFLRWVFAR
jgi:hypothetical protein